MVRTQKFDLDTDTTLGGNNASDYIAPSQKAIKDYVDNHSGGDTEVFVATYNVTSHSDLLTAYNAGKTLVFKVPMNNNVYYFTEYDFINNEFVLHPTINNKKNTFIIYSAGWETWEYGNDIYDVQINGTSIVSSGEANILTNSAYSSSNKIATMSDLPAEQVNSDWNANSGKAQILNKPNLSTVATSGNYNDLSNKPTIPTVGNGTITITQGGTTKGTFTTNQSGNATIALDAGGTVDIDNSTITENSSNQLQTVAVKDNRSGNALKLWTGTKAQYDAISTKDSNTLYNITDDQDITLTLLQTIYPVGSVYLSTNATCPLASLFGTWTLVSSGKALWTGTGSNGGSTISAGLPNITGNTGVGGSKLTNFSGAFYKKTGTFIFSTSTATEPHLLAFDASQSNPIYGNSTTVQPPAYVVNVWRRTA